MLEDTDTLTELNHSSNVHAASPVYSLADEDQTQTASDVSDVEPENNKSCYKKSSIDEVNKENDGPRKFVRFCIDDNTEAYKAPKINTDFDTENPHILNVQQQCNVDNKLTNAIEDLTLENIEQPITIDEDLCSQSLLKNMESNETPQTFGKDSCSQSTLNNLEISETSQTYDEYLINDTCGQDMAEYDREIINLIEPEVHGSKAYDKDSIRPKVAPIIQNTPATVKNIPDVFKAPEIAAKKTNNLRNLNTNEMIKNKPTKDVKVQKKMTAKNKNKENKPPKKRRIKRVNSKFTANDDNMRVFTPLTTNYEVASTNPIKSSNKRFSTGQEAVNNIEMKTDSNKVQTSGTQNSSNTVQIAEQNITTMNRTKNVCLEDDLSWVENLTYVREIHLEEYDPVLKPNSESFWDNCELPYNWDDREFEWT